MKLLSLREIEGPISPHAEFLKTQANIRSKYFKGIKNPENIAKFIGGEKVNLNIKETWCIKKEIFPGVEIYIIFYDADDEFVERINVLFSGEKIKEVSGEDLASLSILVINQMIRGLNNETYMLNLLAH